MFIFNCYIELSLEVASVTLAVFCFHVYIWAVGRWWVGIWSNWSLFQSCYFPVWFGKKSLHTKSKKYKEAFWLTNLVSFKFSSCGESWKITSEKRLLVTYRRDICMHMRQCVLQVTWSLAQPLMDAIETYWLLNLKQNHCVAFRFMTS